MGELRRRPPLLSPAIRRIEYGNPASAVGVERCGLFKKSGPLVAVGQGFDLVGDGCVELLGEFFAGLCFVCCAHAGTSGHGGSLHSGRPGVRQLFCPSGNGEVDRAEDRTEWQVIGQFFCERSECGLKKCSTPQGRSHLFEVADEPVTLGRPEGQKRGRAEGRSRHADLGRRPIIVRRQALR